MNAKRGVVLHHFNFQKPVKDIQFSPDGRYVPFFNGQAHSLTTIDRYIAVTHGAHIQVWETPNRLVREFAPFNLHRTYTGHHDDVLSVQWSPDSRYAIEHPIFFFFLLTLLQNIDHYFSRYDRPSIHTESVRGVSTENFRRSSRCCVGRLFFGRWYIGEWQGSCSLLLIAEITLF